MGQAVIQIILCSLSGPKPYQVGWTYKLIKCEESIPRLNACKYRHALKINMPMKVMMIIMNGVLIELVKIKTTTVRISSFKYHYFHSVVCRSP